MCHTCVMKFKPNELPGIWNDIEGQQAGGQALFNIDNIIEKGEVDVSKLQSEEIGIVVDEEWMKRLKASPAVDKVSNRRERDVASKTRCGVVNDMWRRKRDVAS